MIHKVPVCFPEHSTVFWIWWPTMSRNRKFLDRNYSLQRRQRMTWTTGCHNYAPKQALQLQEPMNGIFSSWNNVRGRAKADFKGLRRRIWKRGCSNARVWLAFEQLFTGTMRTLRSTVFLRQRIRDSIENPWSWCFTSNLKDYLLVMRCRKQSPSFDSFVCTFFVLNHDHDWFFIPRESKGNRYSTTITWEKNFVVTGTVWFRGGDSSTRIIPSRSQDSRHWTWTVVVMRWSSWKEGENASFSITDCESGMTGHCTPPAGIGKHYFSCKTQCARQTWYATSWISSKLHIDRISWSAFKVCYIDGNALIWGSL